VDYDLRTSEDWQKICDVLVYDADGWDRKNYQFSWYQEKITREEFEKRLFRSTVIGSIVNKDGSIHEIWKDRQKRCFP
jgi:hypothetical protein